VVPCGRADSWVPGVPPIIGPDGDPVLGSHVISAAAKEKGEGAWRFSRAASKKRIDALIALDDRDRDGEGRRVRRWRV
jgi:hypothetical protein